MTATDSKVLQVTNISPSVTMMQLETLFGFLGTIDEMQVFPKTNTIPVSSKVAFIRYQSKSPVETGQHLSNTVFIDKAIVCVAYAEGKIPDEKTAMQYVAPASSETEDSNQIPGTADPSKVEEIKRTIYVGNLDSKTATAEQLLQFFSTCGEVRFVRMAGDETQPTRFAFVEFADTSSVQNALQLNGMLFGDRPIKVNHSNNAIVKPQNKTQETTAKEIEEAMRRVREAQSLISKALEPDERKRSRSRSRHRRRRSRSGSRRRRSRSRERRRRRSRSKSHQRSRSRRSRSRSDARRRRRSQSRSRKRSQSRKRSRSRKRRSSSKKRKSKSKSRSRSRSHDKKGSRHKKDRKRDRERDMKRRKRSRSRSSSHEGGKKKNKVPQDKPNAGGKSPPSTTNGVKEQHEVNPVIKKEEHEVKPVIKKEQHDEKPVIKKEQHEVNPVIKKEQHDEKPVIKIKQESNGSSQPLAAN